MAPLKMPPEREPAIQSGNSIAFAPFSDSRPYALGEGPSSATNITPLPRPPELQLNASPGPSPFASPRLLPPGTPGTRRIVQETLAARANGALEGVIAFSKSVATAHSPRIVVLSPRRPLPMQLPRALGGLPNTSQKAHGSQAGAAPPPRALQPRVGDGDSALEARGINAKDLSLFSGQRDWLFYPQREYEPLKSMGSPRDHSNMVTALPSTSPDQRASPDQSPRGVRFAKVAPPSNGPTLGFRRFDYQKSDECSSSSPTGGVSTLDGLLDEEEAEEEVEDEVEAEEEEQPRGPRRERTVSFLKRAENTNIERYIRKIKWFDEMPSHEIDMLIRRAKHRMVPRWSTIIREGALGSVFYVLLKGSVRVTSSSGLDIVLTEGISFGEGALVTKVRREANVVAIEPCHLVALTSDACDGLSVELDALKAHIVSQMLARVSNCPLTPPLATLPRLLRSDELRVCVAGPLLSVPRVHEAHCGCSSHEHRIPPNPRNKHLRRR